MPSTQQPSQVWSSGKITLLPIHHSQITFSYFSECLRTSLILLDSFQKVIILSRGIRPLRHIFKAF